MAKKTVLTGIYKIYSSLNPDLFYIGSSVDIDNRMKRHLYQIKNKTHNNPKILNYFNKYGINVFKYEILCVCEKSQLIEKENYYIQSNHCYFNILKNAYSLVGYKHSESAKAKISIKNTGRKMTDEQIQKGVLARVGQKTSKGCKRTFEMRKNLSNKKKKKIVFKDKVYDSLIDFSSEIGIKYQTLYAMLSNRNFNRLNITYHVS